MSCCRRRKLNCTCFQHSVRSGAVNTAHRLAHRKRPFALYFELQIPVRPCGTRRKQPPRRLVWSAGDVHPRFAYVVFTRCRVVVLYRATSCRRCHRLFAIHGGSPGVPKYCHRAIGRSLPASRKTPRLMRRNRSMRSRSADPQKVRTRVVLPEQFCCPRKSTHARGQSGPFLCGQRLAGARTFGSRIAAGDVDLAAHHYAQGASASLRARTHPWSDSAAAGGGHLADERAPASCRAARSRCLLPGRWCRRRAHEFCFAPDMKYRHLLSCASVDRFRKKPRMSSKRGMSGVMPP